MNRRSFLCSTLAATVFAADHARAGEGASAPRSYPRTPVGQIERLDPRLDALLGRDAVIEKLAEGFDWSEGPVWVGGSKDGKLLFSDVPRNVVHQWTERGGLSEFLKPSGYTGAEARKGEPGSNGLTLDRDGRLILCQHGDRRVARLEKDGTQTVIAERYEGKRFNSPNDVVVKSNGDVYFTDPPYGLEGKNADPKKEIPFNGVYRVEKKTGTVTLLTKELTFPNGLAFTPDEKHLVVAVSDPKGAIYMKYPVKDDGTLGEGKVFFDATPLKAGRKGLPDGIKFDKQGNLWGTGPGGVLVFAPDGTHLGTIIPGEATANCGWGNDGSVLYMTSDSFICRIQTRTKGKLPG